MSQGAIEGPIHPQRQRLSHHQTVEKRGGNTPAGYAIPNPSYPDCPNELRDDKASKTTGRRPRWASQTRRQLRHLGA